MNILFDTCAYIWYLTEPEKLSKKAIELISDKNNTFFLSSVSIWEILIKIKIGKLQIKGDIDKLTDITMLGDFIKQTKFGSDDANQITKIILHHKDPFDLMLICQSISNSYTILTPDVNIKKYNIQTLW